MAGGATPHRTATKDTLRTPRSSNVMLLISCKGRSPLGLQLESREPQVGPVCCRLLLVEHRLPAHSDALGTCMFLLTVLKEPSILLLLSGAAGRHCLLPAFLCWVPSSNMMLLNSFKGRSPLGLQLQSREPQVGPACCRLLLVECRLPAHSAALGKCIVLLTVLKELLIGRLSSGAARRFFVAGLSVLGAVQQHMMLLNSFRDRSPLGLQLESREPQVGPVCCRLLLVECRLPAHPAALGTCIVLLTVLREPPIGLLFSGAAGRPCLLSAFLC